MNDVLLDTPLVARLYCPSCEPNADPQAEILDVLWCSAHTPARAGLDDALTGVSANLVGGAECEGETNRRWCDAIHGGQR